MACDLPPRTTTWQCALWTSCQDKRPECHKDPHLLDKQRVRQAYNHQQRVVQVWAVQWYSQCLVKLVPRQAWKQKNVSVRKGHMGHIINKSNMGKQALRLCRIKEVYPDKHGHFCTCTVQFGPRHVTNKTRAKGAKALKS